LVGLVEGAHPTTTIGDFVRRISTQLLLTLALALAGATSSALAGVAYAATTYTPETPAVDTISGGPWNTSQGASKAGEPYALSDELSGTTTETGMFPITFTALNGVGAGAEQSFTLTVLPFHITTSSLPTATLRVQYATRLEAAGGVAPYTWEKDSGALPKGLHLGPKGMLAGRPAQTGTFSFTVTASDHTAKVHQTSTVTLTLTVVA
jgi:hypothetical protein